MFAATFIIYNRTMEPLSLCLCAGLVPSAQDTIVAWYMHSVMYFTHMMLPSSSGAMADDTVVTRHPALLARVPPFSMHTMD